MPVVKLLTQAEYAKHRGCSAVAVHKAVKAGRISLIGEKIDPAVADIQWAQNTRARIGTSGSGQPPEIGGELPFTESDGIQAQPAQVSPAPAPDGYTAARVRTENANAALAELELARKRSEVRDVVEITRGGFDIARELRDAMDASVNTLATELAMLDKADACAKVLRQHNRTIQLMLAERLREKLGVRVEAA